MGITCGIWTTAFIIKALSLLAGFDIITVKQNENKPTQDDTDFRNAVIIAVLSIVTELIPLYVVIDPKFVKIFSMEFLSKTDLHQDNDSLLETNF